MSNSIFHSLPPPVECLAILLGIAELSIFGIAGLMDPTSFATGFGLPLPPKTFKGTKQLPPSSSSPADRVPADPTVEDDDEETIIAKRHAGLCEGLAARNVASGLCVLAFGCYWRDRRALGTVVLINIVTTATDVFSVSRYGVKGAAGGHWVGLFNTSVIGSLLLLGWW